MGHWNEGFLRNSFVGKAPSSQLEGIPANTGVAPSPELLVLYGKDTQPRKKCVFAGCERSTELRVYLVCTDKYFGHAVYINMVSVPAAVSASGC